MGMGSDRLDEASLEVGGSLAPSIDSLAQVLAPDALVWLRCCSTFGSARGQSFAQRLSERLGARVCGHTYIIGGWQSGTRSLAPGERPTWDEGEGVETASDGGRRAMESFADAPRTIHCLRRGLPSGW